MKGFQFSSLSLINGLVQLQNVFHANYVQLVEHVPSKASHVVQLTEPFLVFYVFVVGENLIGWMEIAAAVFMERKVDEGIHDEETVHYFPFLR